MPHFFIILLKINLVLVLFGAAYYLILRRLTFYTLNRMFLAFGILFSTVYPFINLTDFFHNQKQISQKVVAFVPELNQKAAALVPSKFVALNWQLLTILFYAGVAFMALRLLMQFLSLYRMHRKSSPGKVANYPVRLLEEAISPFSFWQTVYINPSLHQEKELATILEHERVHVKQWHSLDIILAELSVVFYWFNPGVWLMKKAVKENLEFITDEKILKKGVDRKTYQYSLLDVGNLTPSVAIVNNFNLSDLKKRIKMMNAKRSSRLTLSRYLLVLPVLLLTTLAFTVSKKDISKHLAPIKAVIAKTIAVQTADPAVEVQQPIAKKKRELKTVVAKDSIEKPRLFFSHVVMLRDSVHTPEDFLPTMPVDEETREMMVIALEKAMLEKKMLVARTDTLNGAAFAGRVENVRIGFKRTGKPITGAEPDKNQVIVVTGYPTKRIPADSTVRVSSKMNYFVNGVKIPEESFGKEVNPEKIRGIMIKRKNAQETNLMVELKKN